MICRDIVVMSRGVRSLARDGGAQAIGEATSLVFIAVDVVYKVQGVEVRIKDSYVLL
jgi:hypothetical protein